MIELDVVSATVRSEGRAVDLPPRELALLMTLALAPHVWPSYRLIPLLWPHSAPGRCSSLKVYVHRLRQRLGSDIIHSTNRGYELGESAEVDLWKIQPLMCKPTLSELDRQVLSRFYLQAIAADRSFLNRTPWFESVDRLIVHEISSIAVRLADDGVPRELPRQFGGRAALSRRAQGLSVGL